jgi:hypothetical protein
VLILQDGQYTGLKELYVSLGQGNIVNRITAKGLPFNGRTERIGYRNENLYNFLSTYYLLLVSYST